MAQILLLTMGYVYYGLKKSHNGSVPKWTYSTEAAIQCVRQIRVQGLMNQLFISGNSIFFELCPWF